MRFIILFVFLIPNIALSNNVSEDYENIFQIELYPKVLKNIHLLKSPSLIVSYLSQLNEFVTNHYEVKLLSEETLSIGFGKLKFSRYENNEYFYDVEIKNIGTTEVVISIDDKLSLANFLFDRNFINRIPEELILRVNRKLSFLFSKSNQIKFNDALENDLKNFGSIELAIAINEFNKKDKSTGFSIAHDLASTHKYQLITIFLIILLLLIFRDRIKREA